jgi:hypothetical protein
MRFTLLVYCGCLLLGAQTPPAAPQKCRLGGKVLNSAAGEPLRKAHVTLVNLTRAEKGAAQSAISSRAVTDEAGSFAFEDLDAGKYILSVRRSGFGPRQKGQGTELQLTLAAGEEKRDLVFRLTPLGAISGRILDEDGDPVEAGVTAMAYEYTRAGRQLVARANASANDLGEYRIYGLAPGRYYLRAGGQGGVEEAYAVSFYPAASDPAAAAQLDIGAGQQLRGIDMTLHAGRVTSVRGRAMMPPGCSDPDAGWTTATPHGASSHSNGIRDPEGKFDLEGIPPGPYFLTAGCSLGEQRYSARIAEAGGGDLDGIELRLVPPMELAGQVRIEGQSAVRLSRIRVDLEAQGRGDVNGDHPVKEDGAFVFRNLEPDIYDVVVTFPDELYQKSVRLGDRDVSQSGIDLTAGAAAGKLTIVLGANGGEIEGAVRNDAGEPAASAQVILVPADPQRAKIFCKFAAASLSGHFRMRGVAPGDYKLYAWDHVDINAALYDPDFLRPFDSLAESVQIAENGKESVEIKLLKAPAEP